MEHNQMPDDARQGKPVGSDTVEKQPVQTIAEGVLA